MIDTTTIDQLRQRMIKDMRARNLGPASQKSSLPAYRRFATWLRRSPDTAMAEDFRLFQLHLAEVAVGTVTRNASMVGHRFLFRANLRRHDLAAEIFHVKEQQKAPLILNQGETKRLLTVARTLRDPCCSAWLMCELLKACPLCGSDRSDVPGRAGRRRPIMRSDLEAISKLVFNLKDRREAASNYIMLQPGRDAIVGPPEWSIRLARWTAKTMVGVRS